MPTIEIEGRKIGENYNPFVIAEIGINHEGDLNKAIQMVDDAHGAGCECVKFQCHVIEDEMIPNDVIPGNASESIWEIMKRCALSEDEDIKLKSYVEQKRMIYMSTPFSRAAAVRLESMGVSAYKIGSGECNNYPLIEHIARYNKPIILSTGMNDLNSIKESVAILRKHKTPYALLHCTSMYPTPYEKVRLGALKEIRDAFTDSVIGLSDHSIGNYTSFAAIALGASIIEKHFTSTREWPGPDVPISITPDELQDLVQGVIAIHKSLGGAKDILKEEQPTIDFAYACVVTTRAISKGELFTENNIWVKRPGTGELLAKEYNSLLGKKAKIDLATNHQLRRSDIE